MFTAHNITSSSLFHLLITVTPVYNTPFSIHAAYCVILFISCLYISHHLVLFFLHDLFEAVLLPSCERGCWASDIRCGFTMLTNVSSETHYHSDERSFPLLPKVEPPRSPGGGLMLFQDSARKQEGLTLV